MSGHPNSKSGKIKDGPPCSQHFPSSPYLDQTPPSGSPITRRIQGLLPLSYKPHKPYKPQTVLSIGGPGQTSATRWCPAARRTSLDLATCPEPLDRRAHLGYSSARKECHPAFTPLIYFKYFFFNGM